jgi:hypothetical protein
VQRLIFSLDGKLSANDFAFHRRHLSDVVFVTQIIRANPGPTTSIYNASVVNFYNANGSLARFESRKKIYFEKRSGVVAVNSKVVGLAPA